MSPRPRLVALVEEARSTLLRRGVEAGLWWGGTALAVVLILAWSLAGGQGWRQGSDVPLILDLAVVAGVAAAGVFFSRRLRTRWAPAAVARSLEEGAQLPPGRVVGALEVATAPPVGTSSSLADLAAHRVLSEIQGAGDGGAQGSVPLGPLGESVARWSRLGRRLMGAGAVGVVLLAVAAPARSAGAWSGLAAPWRIMVDPVLPPLVLVPGDTDVLRGEDVVVEVESEGRTTVSLEWQAAGDVARRADLPVDGGRARHRFEGVSARVTYRVRAADGSEAGPYTLTPVDPLFVRNLVVGLAYPDHTGLPDEEVRGEVPVLVLPEGTRLTLEGQATRDLGEAVLLGSPGTADGDGAEGAPAVAVSFQVAGAGFHGIWTPRRGGRFDWRFTDTEGAPARLQPAPLDIRLVADSAPRVEIPLPGVDTLVPPNLRQPLVLEATDDYGLSRLELVAYRVSVDGRRHEPVVQGLDLGGQRAALARPLLDLTRWGLLPGDSVHYYAEAWDNHPRRQSTRTRLFTLRVPDASELRREAEERLEEAAVRLEELAEEAGRQAEQTRDMQREAAGREPERGRFLGATPDDAGAFEERAEMEQALEDQRRLSAEVDSLQAELRALQESMAQAGQSDPAFDADLEELQRLLEEVGGEEMDQRMEALAEALEERKAQDSGDALEDLSAAQEAFRDRLEQSLEQFRRAAVEQDFRATRADAEELARRQRAVADALREGDDPELRTAQQEALAREADALEQRMERLAERLEELEETPAARGVDEARREAQEGQAAMEEAADAARQSVTAAAETADEAAERMEGAAEQLDQARQLMAQERAQAMMEAIRRAGDDALSLARRQGALGRAMEGASPEELAGMRGDQAALMQGVRNLANTLQERSEAALTQNRELAVQMGRTLESMERTIQALERRRTAAPPRAAAEQAVDDLNQVALMALAAAERMSQQGQGQPQTGGDVSQQLEQLAQQQGEVVNQTGQLMPLQLGRQAMEEQLRELAEAQETVAEGLEEVERDPRSGDESLGDLERLAEEARALAQRMGEGRLTPDLMERQEQLFHRLLDAGRSLEREEFSDEREAERASAVDRPEVPPLTPEEMGRLRYELPDAAALQRLSPAVRRLVLEYFERLNRRRGGGGGGP